MKVFKIILPYIIIGLFTTQIFASDKDTLRIEKDTTSVSYYFDNILDSIDVAEKYDIDTFLYGFQNYDPLSQNTPFNSSFGNIGFASKNLLFSTNSEIGFDMGFHSMDAYLYKNENIKYYDLLKPYTRLFYVMGAKREQLFNVIHSQNIKKGLNVGVDYRVINSLGDYYRQKSDNSQVAFNSHYVTENSRYGFKANYIYNRFTLMENGGLTDKTYFEDSTYNDRKLIPVNLLDAESRIKELNIYFKQYFKLNKADDKNTDSINPKKRINLGQIYHSINYEKSSNVYIDDPLSGFYSQIYNDSTTTFDSVRVKKLENILAWSNFEIGNIEQEKNVLLYFQFAHKYFDIYENLHRTFMNQYIPSAFLSFKLLKSIQLKGRATYVIGDYNDGDVFVNCKINYDLGEKKGKLLFDASMKKNEASWLSKRYSSNNFQWDNTFNKQQNIKFSAAYNYKSFQMGLNFYDFKNYVYYDTMACPKQYSPSFNVLSAYVYKNFAMGKWRIDNKIIYQKVFGADIIRLPEFAGNHSFYFTFNMFKSALIAQLGVDIKYTTAYFADSYMPATQQFYLQDEQKISYNHIYADAFINLKIQRARLFIKYQHVNAGLFGHEYYMVPNYPLQDRAFKFGVSWDFHN